MYEEISAGVIVYREKEGKRQYLLIKSRTGDWEFPKGGIEGDEELQQAALREVAEETGIDNVRLVDGFRESYGYYFRGQGGVVIDKEVHVFIGKAMTADVGLSGEHSDVQWSCFEDAINTLPHDGQKEVFRAAHEYLEETDKWH